MATRPANVDKVGRFAADSGETAAVVTWVVVYVVVIVDYIIACMSLILIRDDFTHCSLRDGENDAGVSL
jgi:hypothetical protein